MKSTRLNSSHSRDLRQDGLRKHFRDVCDAETLRTDT
jgi:hypothetical protein